MLFEIMSAFDRFTKEKQHTLERRIRPEGERGPGKMTEIDVDKDESFKAIKDSIPPEFENPNEEQQKVIDALDRQSGFNLDPVSFSVSLFRGFYIQRYVHIEGEKRRCAGLCNVGEVVLGG